MNKIPPMSWLPALLVVVQVAAPPGEPVRQAQRESAARLHEEGRHAEAAEQLERLLAEPGAEPVLHYDAGQSRMAAGHRAHAWRHFRAYLDAAGLSADDRAAGESRLRAAEVGTTPVAFTLVPGDASARVSLQRFGASPQQRPPLDAAPLGGSSGVRLDPGPWEVRVEAVGFAPLVQRVEVGDQPMSIVLTLQPPPTAAPPERGAGRAETAGGAVLLPLGLAALGGAIGVAVAYRATRAEFEPLRARFEQGLCLSEEVLRLEELSTSGRRQQGALIGLGVAAAALVGAGVGLLVHGRARTRAGVALELRPGLAGLTLSGRS